MKLPFRIFCKLLGVSLLAVSCAQPPPPEIVTPSPAAAKVPKPPQSQPMKTPVKTIGKGKSTGIGLEELYPLQQSGEALIYDVRVAYFYNIDHIPGAINWPNTHFDAQIRQREIEIQKAKAAGKPVVLYCTSLLCSEARNVAKKLTRRGYDVSVFTMGIDSWRDAGLPLE